MRLKTLAALLLLATTALAAPRAQILVKIPLAAPADSVRRAAAQIEPRIGEIGVLNSEFLVVGFMADSLGDTLRLAPLKAVPGVRVLGIEQ